MAAGSKACLELVQKIVAQRINSGLNMDKFLSKVTVTKADYGTLTAVMTVDQDHVNMAGTMHGAMTTYLVDCLSSFALATCPEVKSFGVSTNISMTFIRAATIGQEIEIRSTAGKVGGKMAFLSVDIVNKLTGELIAKGSHTKFTAMTNPKIIIPR